MLVTFVCSYLKVYSKGPRKFKSLIFLELGDGWGIAIIDSPVELILIREIQKEMNDDNSYWIGGTTTATENTTVTFFDYYPDSTGKEMPFSRPPQRS